MVNNDGVRWQNTDSNPLLCILAGTTDGQGPTFFRMYLQHTMDMIADVMENVQWSEMCL